MAAVCTVVRSVHHELHYDCPVDQELPRLTKMGSETVWSRVPDRRVFSYAIRISWLIEFREIQSIRQWQSRPRLPNLFFLPAQPGVGSFSATSSDRPESSGVETPKAKCPTNHGERGGG